MNKYISSLAILIIATLFTACVDFKDKKTSIEIVDNHRHYYPILTGQKLDVVFTIKNTGENPLLISDILTSCGCIEISKSSVQNIPKGEEGMLTLSYNSTKNIGFVQHFITLYGNFKTSDKQEIVFDVHVVPNALYTKDYEELYQEEKNKGGNIKDMVDGNENNKGYYLDKDLK